MPRARRLRPAVYSPPKPPPFNVLEEARGWRDAMRERDKKEHAETVAAYTAKKDELRVLARRHSKMEAASKDKEQTACIVCGRLCVCGRVPEKGNESDATPAAAKTAASSTIAGIATPAAVAAAAAVADAAVAAAAKNKKPPPPKQPSPRPKLYWGESVNHDDLPERPIPAPR